MQLATLLVVLVLAAAASHMTRERSARVLLAALLDRLPDLRPEVMHGPTGMCPGTRARTA